MNFAGQRRRQPWAQRGDHAGMADVLVQHHLGHPLARGHVVGSRLDLAATVGALRVGRCLEGQIRDGLDGLEVRGVGPVARARVCLLADDGGRLAGPAAQSRSYCCGVSLNCSESSISISGSSGSFRPALAR